MRGALRRGVAAASLAMVAISGLYLPNAWGRAATLTVIAEGLDNPRGIALTDNGSIYVAEAGAGGTNCQKVPEAGKVCFGMTSSISRVMADGTVKTKVKLPSGAGKDGFASTGATDVAVAGGTFYLTVGGAPPNITDVFGSRAAWFNDLAMAKPLERVADLGKFEAKKNPAGDIIESNPYSVARVEGGTLVADAAGNSLLYVADGARPKVVATFPTQDLEDPEGKTIPAHAVPNTVTVGPDGDYYVGQLTGYPFTLGASRVWKIEAGSKNVTCDAEATSGPCTLYADGLTAIIDIAFGPDDKLYVLEIAKGGLLAAESPDATEEDFTGALLRMDGATTFTEIASEGLVAPAGLAISSDGRIFVTNYGVFPGMGQVVEVTGTA